MAGGLFGGHGDDRDLQARAMASAIARAKRLPLKPRDTSLGSFPFQGPACKRARHKEMHGSPAVLPVADVSCNALLAGHGDRGGDQALLLCVMHLR